MYSGDIYCVCLILGDDDIESELLGGADAELGEGWLDLLHDVVVDVGAIAAAPLEDLQEADGSGQIVRAAARVQDRLLK